MNVAGFRVSAPRSGFVLQETAMGCLPLIVLFVLGALIGHVFWGDNGLLWGCGIGLVLGLLSTGVFLWLLRREQNGKK
jgi:hypothetical protein